MNNARYKAPISISSPSPSFPPAHYSSFSAGAIICCQFLTQFRRKCLPRKELRNRVLFAPSAGRRRARRRKSLRGNELGIPQQIRGMNVPTQIFQKSSTREIRRRRVGQSQRRPIRIKLRINAIGKAQACGLAIEFLAPLAPVLRGEGPGVRG